MPQSKWFIYAAAMAAIVPAVFTTAASAAISEIYGDPATTGSQAGVYTETGTVTSVLTVNTGSGYSDFTISDGTASVLAFEISTSTYSPTIGDNITFTAYNSPYYGAPELKQDQSTGVNVFTETTNSTGNVVASPAVLSIPQFNAIENGTNPLPPDAEGIVELDNVTFSTSPASLAVSKNYTLEDSSGNKATVYTENYTAVAAALTVANAANPGGFSGTYDVIAYADPYSSTEVDVYPLSITAVPEPASLGLVAVGGLSLLARRRSQR